jgi:signal transduction histidine kinase
MRARPSTAGTQIALCIADDGRGIDADSPRLRAGGLGLQGIRDRVLLLGGRLRIRSDAGGTRLVVVFRAPTR